MGGCGARVWWSVAELFGGGLVVQFFESIGLAFPPNVKGINRLNRSGQQILDPTDESSANNYNSLF
jgi:hypothetical protein